MAITYEPIGVFTCIQTSPMESPRQGILAKASSGKIVLDGRIDKQSLEDLEGFDRIWLIYDFHENNRWTPKVRPPRGSARKRGVFGTRSPYRPNSLGMSCVRLGRVVENEIHVTEHDLLDQTPILDIKPYLPYADSFPQAKAGWVADLPEFDVEFDELASEKVNWLESELDLSLHDLLKGQLSFEPTSKKAKRVKKIGEDFEFAYKTWRFNFRVVDSRVVISNVRTGYQKEELGRSDDPYGDKQLHLAFQKQFSTSEAN